MAEVTGFTAERMLVIENETVVDGEIQGDNLILITREGTPIDAGNVRGPIGPVGPSVPDGDKGDITVTGLGLNWAIDPKAVTNAKLADMPINRIKGAKVAGPPVDLTPAEALTMLQIPSSVNEQHSGDVYTPRAFPNPMDISIWNAPIGTMAADGTSGNQYMKTNTGWKLVPFTERSHGIVAQNFGAGLAHPGNPGIGPITIPYAGLWLIQVSVDLGPVGAGWAYALFYPSGYVNANSISMFDLVKCQHFETSDATDRAQMNGLFVTSWNGTDSFYVRGNTYAGSCNFNGVGVAAFCLYKY